MAQDATHNRIVEPVTKEMADQAIRDVWDYYVCEEGGPRDEYLSSDNAPPHHPSQDNHVPLNSVEDLAPWIEDDMEFGPQVLLLPALACIRQYLLGDVSREVLRETFDIPDTDAEDDEADNEQPVRSDTTMDEDSQDSDYNPSASDPSASG